MLFNNLLALNALLNDKGRNGCSIQNQSAIDMHVNSIVYADLPI